MKRLQIESMPMPLRTDSDGVVRVGPTRVTLDTVIAAYRDGNTAEEIVEQYSSLNLADVHGVLAYYLSHVPEVESYLESRAAEAADIGKLIEAQCNQHGIRERLLARQRNQAR